VQLHIISLFKNVGICNRTFCRSLKMCESNFFALFEKCKKVWLQIRTFLHIFAHLPFLKEQLAIWSAKKVQFRNYNLFCAHFRTFTHFCSLKFKCVNWQSHIVLLFENVRKNLQSYIRSCKKSECAKNVQISQAHFFTQKKSDHKFSKCAIAQPWQEVFSKNYLCKNKLTLQRALTHFSYFLRNAWFW